MKSASKIEFQRGEGLVVVFILLAIIGGGVWWLFSHKAAMDRDARTFGREVVENLAVKHDVRFFASNLGPQLKVSYPPSQLNDIQTKFNTMGTPQQPIKIDEQVTFESHFFEPKGFFTAHLFYPSGPATMQVAVSHPVGKWQIDDMTFIADRPQ